MALFRSTIERTLLELLVFDLGHASLARRQRSRPVQSRPSDRLASDLGQTLLSVDDIAKVGGVVPVQDDHYGERSTLGRRTVASDACYSALAWATLAAADALVLSYRRPAVSLQYICKIDPQTLTLGCQSEPSCPSTVGAIETGLDSSLLRNPTLSPWTPSNSLGGGVSHAR